jgi:isopenicillin N synthase-like dioxygenase
VDQLRAFPDLKESFEIGNEPSNRFENNWPADDLLPGFRDHNMQFFKTCHELHLQVMNSIALALGLPDEYFSRFCNKMEHNLRLLHYPQVEKKVLDREQQSRTGAHTDYGSLTLLFQDDRGGLQVKNFDDEFVPAPPIPGKFTML